MTQLRESSLGAVGLNLRQPRLSVRFGLTRLLRRYNHRRKCAGWIHRRARSRGRHGGRIGGAHVREARMAGSPMATKNATKTIET